jgi:putative membrane protein
MAWIGWMSWLLVGLVGIAHIAFMGAEMFAWARIAPKVAGLQPPCVEATKPIGKNQGLYNGFLAAGLIWSLGSPLNASLGAPPSLDVRLAVFFTGCVLIAGVFGALTLKPINRGLLLAQALPALLALIAIWLRG